jgi:NADP-dependent 3-hydroxy acid dehydrogenase YdfG
MMQTEDIAAACVFAASLPARTYVAEMVLYPTALQGMGETIVK